VNKDTYDRRKIPEKGQHLRRKEVEAGGKGEGAAREAGRDSG
jgi:hypothetical protein